MAKGTCCLWVAAIPVALVAFVGYPCLIDHHPGYHKLMDAISNNDVPGVQRLLAEGVNPNDYPAPSADEDDQAPINEAADTGNTKIVGLLVDKGANLQTTDPWGGPPMEIAARNDDVPMIAYLISRGAIVNDLGKDGSSALYGAAVSGKAHALKYLLTEGANPNTIASGQNALNAARCLSENETGQILEKAMRTAHTP